MHSLYRPGSYLTGDYWDGYLVLPFAVAGRDPPRRIAILGNAAGTVARAYGRFFPATGVDAVEIDGELTEIGRRYFDLRNPRMRTFAEDARPWLERSDGGYDAIMVDAYRQPYIPFYLATREFFELARDRLAPRRRRDRQRRPPEGNDDLETTLGRTMAEAFPSVHALSDRGHQHAARGRRGAALRAPGCARSAATCSRRTCAASPAGRPRRSSRGCPAARSTPTTARRSSGWSTLRCSDTRKDDARAARPRCRAWLGAPARSAAEPRSRSTSPRPSPGCFTARRASLRRR